MKILLVQDADWMKKGPHTQHHLMEKLSLKGHDIMVIGFDQLWSYDSDLISKRVSISEIHRFYDGAKIGYIRTSFIKLPIIDYLTYFFVSRMEIKKTINESKPDIIIGVTSVISCYWGFKYAKKNRIPFVYFWTDVIHTLIPIKPLRFVAMLIERKILKESTSVIAINENLKDNINHLARSDVCNTIIPNGVDINRFTNDEAMASYIREKYGVSRDDTLLFFMGWIYKFSGLKEIILDMRDHKDRYKNVKLMIVGEGEYYPAIKDLVSASNLNGKIILTGDIPYEQIPYFIAASDICLMPAYNNDTMRDIVPIKMYEYLAMGKPVISTKLPGILKEFGYNNGVFYIQRPDEVIQKVNNLNNDIIYINKQNSMKYIKKFDWDNITLMFENLLMSIIGDNKR